MSLNLSLSSIFPVGVALLLAAATAVDRPALLALSGGADIECNSTELYSQDCPAISIFNTCSEEWMTCRPESVVPGLNTILCDPDQGTIDPCDVFGCSANGEIDDIIRTEDELGNDIECVTPGSSDEIPVP